MIFDRQIPITVNYEVPLYQTYSAAAHEQNVSSCRRERSDRPNREVLAPKGNWFLSQVNVV